MTEYRMERISELREMIGKEIDRIPLSKEPVRLYEPIGYTLSLGGKRMRPLLTLLACEIFGGKPEDALGAAVGIELFHNFTLLHDDIMDRAPIRRGQPTVYKKWDENTAILSGDTMFALSYRYVMKSLQDQIEKVLEIFTQTAIEVCEGQQWDMDFESKPEVTIPEYMEMIRLKTAALLAASMKIGALIAGASDRNADLAYRFGENAGIAFQLRDDLLDAFSDEEVFGKKTGGDIATNKKTFLYLKSFELAPEETLKRLRRFYDPRFNDTDAKIREVKSIYRELEIDRITRAEAGKYYEQALSHLRSIGVPDERKALLLNFTDRLMKRDS